MKYYVYIFKNSSCKTPIFNADKRDYPQTCRTAQCNCLFHLTYCFT